MIESLLNLLCYGTTTPVATHPIIERVKWLLPAAAVFDLLTVYLLAKL